MGELGIKPPMTKTIAMAFPKSNKVLAVYSRWLLFIICNIVSIVADVNIVKERPGLCYSV